MNDPYDQLVPGGNPTKSQSQENNMNGKPIFKSKTFWVNIITAIAGVLTTVGGSDLIQDNPQMAGIAATVMGVVNIFLRFMTTEKVTIK